jgi:hypothetical protein
LPMATSRNGYDLSVTVNDHKICADADLLRAHLTILRAQKVRLDVASAAFRDVIPQFLRKVRWRLKRGAVFQATRGRLHH